MTRRILPQLIFCLLLASVFGACEKEGFVTTQFYTVNVPIYALRKDVQDSIKALPPQAMCTPGNIYARGTLLFVNELNRGWHVIDNSDAHNPKPLAYWRIPGSNQLAFVDGKVVTDNYGDLVALEVGADLGLKVHSTAANLLSGGDYAYDRDPDVSANLIIGYRLETLEYTFNPDDQMWLCGDFALGSKSSMSASFAADLRASTSGVEAQGSLSRFASFQDYIYSVKSYYLAVYRLTDSIRAVEGNTYGSKYGERYLNQGETAVVQGDQLFVGSATGMYIFGLSDPANPAWLSFYQHTFGCDPVAVDGDRAVVTVRDGSTCRSTGTVNTLAVIDISNPSNPVELSVTRMQHPHGVALYDGRVYVSEGRFGLRVYEFDGARTKPGKLLAESKVPSLDMMVLPYDGGTKLLSISDGGIAQYGTSAGAPLDLESTLATGGCR